jgi:FkbM family methyltransferase
MAGSISLKFGDWLYKNAFGVYNTIYPIFKNRQDKNEIAFIQQRLKPGSIVLDIGANIGFYSKILSSATGSQGHVHCFEPDITNFNHLKNNTKHLNNVTINNLAVSATNDPIKIYLSKELNVDHRTYPVNDYQSIIEINATTIDSYLPKGVLVDFIKMDIQGYEIEALKGMKQTILNSPNIQILMEFWPYGLQSAGYSVAALFELLNELGLEYSLTDEVSTIDFANIDKYESWNKERFTNLYVVKKK